MAGLINGVGGIWLWMGGEKREDRIQKTEYRMSNDEVRSFDFATLRSGCLTRDCLGPAGVAMTSLKRFLRSLRSVGMTRGTGARNKEAPPAGGGANQRSWANLALDGG